MLRTIIRHNRVMKCFVGDTSSGQTISSLSRCQVVELSLPFAKCWFCHSPANERYNHTNYLAVVATCLRRCVVVGSSNGRVPGSDDRVHVCRGRRGDRAAHRHRLVLHQPVVRHRHSPWSVLLRYVTTSRQADAEQGRSYYCCLKQSIYYYRHTCVRTHAHKQTYTHVSH